jgi:hypothetical protein
MDRSDDNLFDDARADRRPDLPGTEPPAELRRVADLLDDEGAFLRASLAEDALERILAASDLQLPVAGTPVAPHRGRAVIARIGPSSFVRVARMAAAIAVVGGLAALGAAFLWRGEDAARSGDSGGVLVEASRPEPARVIASTPSAPALHVASDLAPADFDRWLAAARPESAATRDPVVAAIAMPATVGGSVIATSGFAVLLGMETALVSADDVAGSYDPDGFDPAGLEFGGLDFGGLDFAGLEGEMAAIIRETATFR